MYRSVVLAVAGCYAVYYAVRWIGFGARFGRGRGLSPRLRGSIRRWFFSLFLSGSPESYIVTRP